MSHRNEHTTGSECPRCYTGYPEECRCGGYIHAQYLGEDEALDDDIEVWCGACGNDWTPAYWGKP